MRPKHFKVPFAVVLTSPTSWRSLINQSVNEKCAQCFEKLILCVFGDEEVNDIYSRVNLFHLTRFILFVVLLSLLSSEWNFFIAAANGKESWGGGWRKEKEIVTLSRLLINSISYANITSTPNVLRRRHISLNSCWSTSNTCFHLWANQLKLNQFHAKR